MPVPGPSEQRVKEVLASVYMRSPRERPVHWREIQTELPLYSLEEGEESLGLDSLDAVEIATELEEAFDVVMPTEIDPVEIRTVQQILDLLQQLLREQRGDAS